eukprot:15367148-Ditylum_brightwellii.AAC.2
MACHNNKCTMTNLHETVHCVSVKFSDKYISEPTSKQVTKDLILALHEFKQSCRWKEHWHNRRIKQLNSANPNALEHAVEKKNSGLNTGLKPEKTGHVPIESTPLENFLKDVKRDLLRKAVIKNKSTEEIQAAVPTDKTNAHKVVDLEDYTEWIKDHLDENATMIHCRDIVKIHEKMLYFAEELKPLLNPQEYNFLIDNINSHATPESQLLIKDHKKLTNGAYPTCLIISSLNFAVNFSKTGYLGVKHILDTNKVNYT